MAIASSSDLYTCLQVGKENWGPWRDLPLGQPIPTGRSAHPRPRPAYSLDEVSLSSTVGQPARVARLTHLARSTVTQETADPTTVGRPDVALGQPVATFWLTYHREQVNRPRW